MLTRLFASYGTFCASHPWEMILTTLTTTVVLFSYTLVQVDNRICGWNYSCDIAKEEVLSSDTIIMTLVRCLAVVYVYMQISKLRKYGSKYLLVLAGLLTTLSGFIFSSAVVFLLQGDLQGLNEALPFFLVLVDLRKIRSLARYAFAVHDQSEVASNIGRGMAVLGPLMTLDTGVGALTVAVGMLSGVRVLETMCCFGCLSLLINWVAFMTFYPACLALISDLSVGSRQKLAHMAKLLEAEEGSAKPNPLSTRLKVIVSLALVLVHAQSRFLSGRALGTPTDPVDEALRMEPKTSLARFYLGRVTSSLSVDYVIALSLAGALVIKYVMLDSSSSSVIDDASSTEGDSEAEEGGARGTEEVSPEGDVVDGAAVGKVVEDGSDRKLFGTTIPQNPDVNSKRGALFSVGGSEENSSDEDEKKISKSDAQTQTGEAEEEENTPPTEPRSHEECVAVLNSKGAYALSDAEVLGLVRSKHVRGHQLEKAVCDRVRGVSIRRQHTTQLMQREESLENLPFRGYDYKYVEGACCENVIGYMPLPVGVAGPLLIDGQKYIVPMATTEGCLVASVNRGATALTAGDGVHTAIIKDGMSRAPALIFPTAMRACEAKLWLDDKANFDAIAESFNSTSRFARLKELKTNVAGQHLYIRVVGFTGDAMGMNMMSKGTEQLLKRVRQQFPDMQVVSLSGNFCTDKKAAAINWIEGRGKSVVAEAVVPARTVATVLKTTARALADLNVSKNLIGSALAGTIGGNNAHAANIVTAVFIATGQDAAQNVASSNCMTLLEACGPEGEDLHVTCSMPSLEVGTVGGGTILPPQAACLELLGVRGSCAERPGQNARRLAKVICATVMAGELSLLAALSSGDLVRSHLKHNRSSLTLTATKTLPVISEHEGRGHRKTSSLGTCIQNAS